ncbi:hypothetical protein [Rhodococcus qingshengii]|uniref:hypothetical protein n=1 Tax=Rhodococcus qingshengii TaxID=334542 RepID=UPI001BE90A01|nr:hypothetical protein [Rhodococcus qingshengii]MBT2272111.1 hypothetical protein [Rhodococcus qingshengii]
MPQPPVEALNHPWVVYAAIILIISGFAVSVSKRLQEALGPFGRWISKRQERAIERQRSVLIARGSLDDVVAEQLRADIRDIASQMVAQRERHNEAIRQLRREHAAEIEEIRSAHRREMTELRRQFTER